MHRCFRDHRLYIGGELLPCESAGLLPAVLEL